MRLISLIAATVLVFGAGAAADELIAKPVPGNKPCPYPPQAQKEYVAGPVHFVVQVRPDGTTASVDVNRVPGSDLGFEDAVRTCISGWRFEPAPGGVTGPRQHEGRLRFRIAAAEETAIRALLEAFAASWNAGDVAAVEELALRSGDSEAVRAEGGVPMQEQLRSEGPGARWRMELTPDIDYIRFLRTDLAAVRQRYR